MGNIIGLERHIDLQCFMSNLERAMEEKAYRNAAAEMRKIVEYVCNCYILNLGAELKKFNLDLRHKPLHEKISGLYDAALLPGAYKNLFHSIRMEGNAAVHGDVIDPGQIEEDARALNKYLVGYFAKGFAGAKIRIPESNIAQDRAMGLLMNLNQEKPKQESGKSRTQDRAKQESGKDRTQGRTKQENGKSRTGERPKKPSQSTAAGGERKPLRPLPSAKPKLVEHTKQSQSAAASPRQAGQANAAERDPFVIENTNQGPAYVEYLERSQRRGHQAPWHHSGAPANTQRPSRFITRMKELLTFPDDEEEY